MLSLFIDAANFWSVFNVSGARPVICEIKSYILTISLSWTIETEFAIMSFEFVKLTISRWFYILTLDKI